MKPRRRGKRLIKFLIRGIIVVCCTMTFFLPVADYVCDCRDLKEAKKPPGDVSSARSRSVWRRQVLNKSRQRDKTKNGRIARGNSAVIPIAGMLF